MAGILKLLDPIIAPAAKLYRAQLAKDLNKMGEFRVAKQKARIGEKTRVFLGVVGEGPLFMCSQSSRIFR